MPKKKSDEESMAEEVGYKESEDLVNHEEMMKYAQMRAADKQKTFKNKDSRISNRSKVLLSNPDLYRKSKLKMKKDDEY